MTSIQNKLRNSFAKVWIKHTKKIISFMTSIQDKLRNSFAQVWIKHTNKIISFMTNIQKISNDTNSK
jgi:hypothetical protein